MLLQSSEYFWDWLACVSSLDVSYVPLYSCTLSSILNFDYLKQTIFEVSLPCIDHNFDAVFPCTKKGKKKAILAIKFRHG